ncbi:hypothetical protein Sya03_16970 [Spirilliplanes yamanashiensis]|uniref:Uncharacterized protein n=1 Tax=Spirilliplanes yamanashiensis TaxID=42233 RepID=A0A8J3Y6A7_9ACTN|nr:hypothetical protein Sya03_16970 [Spirilliplanes yamanashiensis]
MEPDEAPELWALTTGLAAEAGARAPGELRLVAEPTVAVTAGARRLSLGLPLLPVLSAGRLRAVLAHEFRHRPRPAILRAVGRFGPRRPVAVAPPELPRVAAAWARFLDEHLRPGSATGCVPDDVSGGFRHFLAARGEPADDHPAVELLPDPAGWERALWPDARPVSWDEFATAAVAAGQQRLADGVFRAVARRTGRPVQPGIGLAELLDLVAAGRLGEVAAEVLPDVPRDEAAQRFADPMTQILELAAVRSQVAHRRHAWTGPAPLMDRAGHPLDLAGTGRLACAPWTLGEARDRLAVLGVNLWHTGLVEAHPGAAGAGVLAAMTLDVAGARTDVVLLDQGFVLAPADTGGGRDRLRALVGSASGDELAQRHAFVPFADVEGGTTGRLRAVRARLALRGGGTMVLRERLGGAATLDATSRDEFKGALRALTRRRSGRHGR